MSESVSPAVLAECEKLVRGDADKLCTQIASILKETMIKNEMQIITKYMESTSKRVSEAYQAQIAQLDEELKAQRKRCEELEKTLQKIAENIAGATTATAGPLQVLAKRTALAQAPPLIQSSGDERRRTPPTEDSTTTFATPLSKRARFQAPDMDFRFPFARNEGLVAESYDSFTTPAETIYHVRVVVSPVHLVQSLAELLATCFHVKTARHLLGKKFAPYVGLIPDASFEVSDVGVIVTVTQSKEKRQCNLCKIELHPGIARAVVPATTDVCQEHGYHPVCAAFLQRVIKSKKGEALCACCIARLIEE